MSRGVADFGIHGTNVLWKKIQTKILKSLICVIWADDSGSGNSVIKPLRI